MVCRYWTPHRPNLVPRNLSRPTLGKWYATFPYQIGSYVIYPPVKQQLLICNFSVENHQFLVS